MPSSTLPRRLLLHPDERSRRAIDPHDVYLLEADDNDTLVRQRSRTVLRDRRRLPELVSLFTPFGFLRIHRSYAVNLDRVREVRLRDGGRDWEVVLEPPVNRVVPVGRDELDRLWAAFGERGAGGDG